MLRRRKKCLLDSARGFHAGVAKLGNMGNGALRLGGTLQVSVSLQSVPNRLKMIWLHNAQLN